MEPECYPCQLRFAEDGPTLQERMEWLLEQRGKEAALPCPG